MDILDNLTLMSEVIPHLYITNWESSHNGQILDQYNIKAVLTAEMAAKTSLETAPYVVLGIEHAHIYIDDDAAEDISRFFDTSYDFIHRHIQAGNNIIVHCRAGISRSVSLVMNYLLRRMYESTSESYPKPQEALNMALNKIRETRPFAQPNGGFVRQLYERAKEYNSMRQSNLSQIEPSSNPDRMNVPSDPRFMQPASAGNMPNGVAPSSSSEPNIIYLTNEDFDAQGNLVNFRTVNGVVWFFSHGCGHCQHMKGEYEKFAALLSNSPMIRAFAVDTAKHRDLMSRIRPDTFGYAINGVPFIVGYDKGKFYSEYSDDDRSKFRTADSMLQYAAGIGSAPVERVAA